MTAASCAVCAGPDVFGLGMCPECGGTGSTADSLVFIRRPAKPHDRASARQRLADLLGERTTTADGVSALNGNRALVRLPMPLARLAVDHLEQYGVPARAIPGKRAWIAMPSHFFVMLGAIAIMGAMAGAIEPMFVWSSPLLAALLILVAQRSMQRPLLRPVAANRMPAVAESAMGDAFAQIAGRPRELLADLVRVARPLHAALLREGDPAAIAPSVVELLCAGCATALEVDRLEQAQTVIRDAIATGEHGNSEAGLHTAARRCADAASLGTRRLIEAVTTIADISGRTAIDDATGSRLARLTRELGEALRLHQDALREADALLAR